MALLSFPQPGGLRVWESEKIRAEYNIQQGFCYSRVEECKDAFRFAALIDIKKLPDLINSCAALLTDESFFVLEYYPDKITNVDDDTPAEPTIFYSPYMETAEILEILAPYLSRLIHDGFVGFGLANSRQGAELFYSEEKAFTCFTANHIRAMNIFTQHGLRFKEQLLFPADFAHDHFSLISLNSRQLPHELQGFSRNELDYVNYCGDLVELFEMQCTTSGEEFYLSAKEQDYISDLLEQQPELNWSSDDEFIHLLLDWKEFVKECNQGFDGTLEDYESGLKVRDIIATVTDKSEETIRTKLLKFIDGADTIFKHQLVETARHIPESSAETRSDQIFWRWGVTRKQGATLRRDLIRSGWFATK